MQPTTKLERRVTEAAERVLKRRRFVSPVDVLIELGWLTAGAVTRWQQGRTPELEALAAVTPERLADVLEILQRWVAGRGLSPSEAEYVAATRDRRALRFTADGGARERAYRVNWILAELSERQRESLKAKQSKPPDLVVVQSLKEFTCSGCGRTDAELLTMEDAGPVCLVCADLDHLVFLPSGDAAMTRRAKQASRLSAVVVRFSRSRRRHERQGLLVEQAAIEQAEQACLSDEEARARRRERDKVRREAADETFQEQLADRILQQFPRCPPERAAAISRHAGERGSGRVGRSAAGRELDPEAVKRAVIASVRHENTPYDDLLMNGVPRDEARDQIRPAIDKFLEDWRR